MGEKAHNPSTTAPPPPKKNPKKKKKKRGGAWKISGGGVQTWYVPPHFPTPLLLRNITGYTQKESILLDKNCYFCIVITEHVNNQLMKCFDEF